MSVKGEIILVSEVKYITFEVRRDHYTNGTVDKYYRVTRREGKSGDCPPVIVLHDSHFADDAIKAASKEMRKSVKNE